jgi:hypothetical protein
VPPDLHLQFRGDTTPLGNIASIEPGRGAVTFNAGDFTR